jgi:hypothetical protein
MLLALSLLGCEDAPDATPSASSAASATTHPTSATATSSAATSAAATSTASTSSRPDSKPSPSCPADMVLVDGDYCPVVKHRCLEHAEDYEQAMKRRDELRAQGKKPGPLRAVERCLRYAEPSRCLAETRRPLRFCMDRYEWPNRIGETPRLLVSWLDAKALCEEAGKRLCTADEFNFACEGEAMLPYSYGFERDPERCNIDKPYVTPQKLLLPEPDCAKKAWCRDHLAELDQRVPIGSTTRCTSPFGVHDINGNVNEWVARPGEKAPNRSGLKGGWWGPARSRCRPMVTAHDEEYVGYEVGFRCCRDANPPKAASGQSTGGSQ